MAPTKYESESSGNSKKNRVHEDSGKITLPEFDSLPASAGLNNAEAFRLSLRHALALLPARLAQGTNERSPETYLERFSIR